MADGGFPGSLGASVLNRHSIRYYTDEPVSDATIKECIWLAQHAPSNSNMQNWSVNIARGAARDRIAAALRAEAALGDPKIPPMPDAFKHYRSDFGHKLYGPEGYDVPREDKEQMLQKRLRNYEFFGAPVVGVISMHRDLASVDAMCVGLFVQTLLLALTERGLGSILQVSVAGYPELMRKEFKLPEEQTILCGIAIGHVAEHKVNEMNMPRDEIDDHFTLHTE